jgi:cytosine/adenosine deaminase-related metal-dependent hydrolase
MTSGSILLKDGVALLHDGHNHVVPTKISLLIENGKIVKLAQHIAAPEGVELIDCTDKIISPGFIDTHRHGWQTQLKGRHADEQLIEYMVTGKHLYTDGSLSLPV